MRTLSVIDTDWPGDVIDLIPLLDACGYHRFWATEHHSPLQSASPTLVAGLAAGLSSQLRVGTAGILVNFATPFRIVADFRLLQCYFPDRLDLGLVGAIPRRAEIREALLDGRPEPTPATYENRVKEVVDLARGHGEAAAGPDIPGMPQLWLGGMGVTSARVAGRLGMRFAFHHYFAQHHSREGRRDVVQAYRESFVPSPELPQPYLAIACYGLCASTRAEADLAWQRALAERRGANEITASSSPSFCGSATECQSQLDALVAEYEAEELIIQQIAPQFAMRADGYRRLADAML